MILSRVNPSVVLPGILTPQIQKVDFEKYIGSKTSLASTKDEMVYVVTAQNINSETSVGQQWNQGLTRQTYSLGQLGLPLYRINAYIEYDENEQAKFEALSNGVGLPNFLENLAKQGINQRKHQGILFGFDSTKSQGIVANSTDSNLPADSAGANTILTYNIAELQAFLSQIARSVMDTTFGASKPVVIASSQRVINYLKTAIVPLASNQANGGGVESIAQTYSKVISKWLGVGKVDFVADDLLKEAGTNSKDIILFIAPGADSQEAVSEDVNQNLVGDLNSINYNTMYDAGEGLRKIERPADFDIFSSLLTYKMTPGATLRSEAVVKVEVSYQ